MSAVETLMAAVLTLNSLGVFVLLFKSGVLVGQNDQRWQDLYKRFNALETVVKDGNESKIEIARLQEAVRALQKGEDQHPKRHAAGA